MIGNAQSEEHPALAQCKAELIQEEYDAVIATCTEALSDVSTDEERAAALNLRAIAYLNKRDPTNALADLNTSIALDDVTDGAVYSDRGALFFSLGEYDRALSDYDEALRRVPEDGNIYSNRGWAKLGRGDYESALADFEKAGSMLTDDPQQKTGQAGALFALGRFEESAEILRDLSQRWLHSDLVLWMLIAEWRAGDLHSDSVETAEAYVEPDVWPRPVADYLAGKQTANVMEQAAAAEKPRQGGPTPLCQAAFYVGETSLSLGNDDDARTRLRRATEICALNTFERIVAQAELKRISQ